MRKNIFLLVVFVSGLVWPNYCGAQLKTGQIELSFGAAYSGVKAMLGRLGSASDLSTRLGYFLTKEFEFEPEVTYFAHNEIGTSGLMLNGNFLYNYPMVHPLRVSPFFLAGFGWANYLHHYYVRNLQEKTRNYLVLNIGAGLKPFLSRSVSLRLEYRFQRLIAEEEYTQPVYFWQGSSRFDPSLSFHSFMLGVSVFLK